MWICIKSLKSLLLDYSRSTWRSSKWKYIFDTNTNYSDVIVSAMPSRITGVSVVCSTPFVKAQMKEHIKAPRHWPLRGESRWPLGSPQKVSNAQNVSIWWRHHACLISPIWPAYIPLVHSGHINYTNDNYVSSSLVRQFVFLLSNIDINLLMWV